MAKKSSKQEITKTSSQELISDGIVDELRELIQQTRSAVAQTVNSAQVQMYWKIVHEFATTQRTKRR